MAGKFITRNDGKARKKWTLPVSTYLIIFVIFFTVVLSAPAVALSQNNTTATFVSAITQSALQACENIQRGEVCLGSAPVTAASADGSKIALNAPGDVSPITG